jgi:two-component system repressor protein LuxO
LRFSEEDFDYQLGLTVLDGTDIKINNDYPWRGTVEMNNSQPTILLVDDERPVLSSLTRCLARLGVNLVDFNCPQQAMEYATENRPDLVISDQRMPLMQGSEMLGQIKAMWPDVQTIILSGYSDLESFSDALNRRIIDRFISKPWDNNELRMVASAALREQGLFGICSEKNPPVTAEFHGMLSTNPAMYRLFERITKSARANIPIFISGDTGTGKELVARACHAESPRKSQPFIPINCANFNEHLIESQLFGHKKGAFTGATAEHHGLFAAAQQGTLFLDEVTTLPLPLQAKLLRVIQEREFSPVGSHQTYPFAAQLLTASSTTLAEAVERGQFREDLYYRLNVIPLKLPPLRDRGEDVVLMAEHFLQFFARHEQKRFKGFTESAKGFLRQYPWPGNVRQLENLTHSIVVLTDQPMVEEATLQAALEGDIRRGPRSKWPAADDGGVSDSSAPPHSRTQQPGFSPQSDYHDLAPVRPLWQVEKSSIEEAIAFCGGNVPRAAALLEVSPSTIYRKQKHW